MAAWKTRPHRDISCMHMRALRAIVIRGRRRSNAAAGPDGLHSRAGLPVLAA
jgi:hypothetical protein